MMTRKTKSVNFQKILYTYSSLKNKNRFFIKTPLKHGLDAAMEATACLYQVVCIHVGYMSMMVEFTQYCVARWLVSVSTTPET